MAAAETRPSTASYHALAALRICRQRFGLDLDLLVAAVTGGIEPDAEDRPRRNQPSGSETYGFTIEQYQALQAPIAEGALSVRYADKVSPTGRSFDEIRILKLMANDLGLDADNGGGRRFTSFSKDLPMSMLDSLFPGYAAKRSDARLEKAAHRNDDGLDQASVRGCGWWAQKR